MVKFGLEFVPRELYWKTTFYAIQAERSGFEYLWITDHFNNRNVYVSLAIVSAYTNSIKFGPGVTNPYLCHPIVTAQAVASLAEIAPARVICGIGVGDKTTLSMVNTEQVKPLAAIRESVGIIRSITSGKDAVSEGEVFKVSGVRLNFSIGSQVPIYLGAQGPRMLSLAAEVGDGVLINASHPRDIESALGFIKEGAAKAGRGVESLDVAAYTSFSVHEDPKRAIKAVVPVVAFIVAGSPDVVLQRHGIQPEIATKIRDAISHERWGDAFGSVTPEMVQAFSVCGTPEECVERISRLVKLGVTQFVTGSPIGPNVRRSINTIGTKILPNFKG